MNRPLWSALLQLDRSARSTIVYESFCTQIKALLAGSVLPAPVVPAKIFHTGQALRPGSIAWHSPYQPESLILIVSLQLNDDTARSCNRNPFPLDVCCWLDGNHICSRHNQNIHSGRGTAWIVTANLRSPPTESLTGQALLQLVKSALIPDDISESSINISACGIKTNETTNTIETPILKLSDATVGVPPRIIRRSNIASLFYQWSNLNET